MAEAKKTSGRKPRSGVKKTTAKRKKVSADEYNDIVDVADLLRISLTNMEFNIEPEYFSGGDDLNYSYDFDNGEVIYSEENGYAGQEYTWVVDVKLGRKKVLKVKGTFLSLYGGLRGKDFNAIEMFLDRVAKFSTYPYFRTLVSQVSGMAEAQLPIMPVINNLAGEQPETIKGTRAKRVKNK